MKHFPIYLKVGDKRICLIGNDDDAVAKARLVAKSEATIEIYSAMPDEGQINAIGALVCDQYRHARQSGCDGVLITAEQAQKMPEPHWLEQARRVPISYRLRLYA